MKLKEERNVGTAQRTRVNRAVHPHSSSSPGAALGSVPTVALSSAQVVEVYHRKPQDARKPFDHVTVLIRRSIERESLRLFASSRCPLDLAVWPGVFPIWSGEESRRTIE